MALVLADPSLSGSANHSQREPGESGCRRAEYSGTISILCHSLTGVMVRRISISHHRQSTRDLTPSPKPCSYLGQVFGTGDMGPENFRAILMTLVPVAVI